MGYLSQLSWIHSFHSYFYHTSSNHRIGRTKNVFALDLESIIYIPFIYLSIDSKEYWQIKTNLKMYSLIDYIKDKIIKYRYVIQLSNYQRLFRYGLSKKSFQVNCYCESFIFCPKFPENYTISNFWWMFSYQIFI